MAENQEKGGQKPKKSENEKLEEFVWNDLKQIYNLIVVKGADEVIQENTTEEGLREQIRDLIEETKNMNKEKILKYITDLSKEISKLEEELDEEIDFEEDVNRDFKNCYILEGLPITTKNKSGKLEQVIIKRIIELCKIEKEDLVTFHIPFDEEEKSQGFAFIEFAEKIESHDIIKSLHQKPLIKTMSKYILKIQPYMNIDKYVIHADDFKKNFSKEKFKFEKRIDHWLHDKHAREMYISREKNHASVNWFDPDKEKVEKAKTFKGDYYVKDELRWSPKGSYLVAFNPQRKEFELYGGMEFEKLKSIRVANKNFGKGVRGPNELGSQSFVFSPQETFFCVKQATQKHEFYLVYDVRSASLRKVFTVQNTKKTMNFKWNCSDRYLACGSKDKIDIYETKNFEIIKTIREKGIIDFEWSPSDNLLSYYTREVKEQKMKPKKGSLKKEKERSEGTLFLVKVPSLQIVKSKSYYDVESVKINWQNNGEFFALMTEEKNIIGEELEEFKTNVDLFHITKKGSSFDVSVGNIIVEEKIDKFHWEPTGGKFAYVSIENKKEEDLDHITKNNLTLYKMENGQAHLVKHFPLQSTDTVFIHWSPRGKYFVLVEIKFSKTKLEFWNTEPCEAIGYGEHFITGQVEWDPSGRYLMASTTRNKSQDSNGFVVYQLGGKVLYTEKVQQLWEVKWRKRPNKILSDSQSSKLKKKFPKYVKKYLREEKEREKAMKREIEKRIEREWNDFEKARADGLRYLEEKGESGDMTIDEYYEEVKIKEEVVEEKIEYL